MSGSWLDFDPLANRRSVPAAPVTSMEQAEVLPTKPSHRSGDREDVAGVNSNSPSETLGKAETGSNPKSSPSSANDDSQTPDQPSQAAVDSESQDQSAPSDKEDPSIDKDLLKEPEPTESQYSDMESASAQPVEIPEEGDQSEKELLETEASDNRVEPEESSWPPKLSDVAPEAEGTHPGDLRKNSIAAMRELGTPIASVSNSETESDDTVGSFDFQKFMDCLRTKSADPIARYIKSFLQEFSRAVWTPKQQEKIVSDFHKFITVKLRDFEPFASMNKHDRLNSLEGVEKLVMNRLYPRTFPPKMAPILRTDGHNEDLLNDQVFEEKMRLWGWVEGRHLDINDEYLKSTFIQLATTELGRLHQFKSPRDKMICILNCSKVIYALIRQAKLEQNADSFLPLLIYVVIKSHPIHLVSTINYIQRFRAKEFMRGESAYYLSTLASAVAFVQSLDQSSLTITAEEFEQRMTDSARMEQNRKHQQQAEEELMDHPDGSHQGESSAAVLTASAGMLVERMRQLTTKFLDDFANPEEERQQATQQNASDESRNAIRNYRNDARAAREASQEEYRVEQEQREQFKETSETLQSMFPSLDKDVIEDVLRQSGTNIGSAVDICLALNG